MNDKRRFKVNLTFEALNDILRSHHALDIPEGDIVSVWVNLEHDIIEIKFVPPEDSTEPCRVGEGGEAPVRTGHGLVTRADLTYGQTV